MMQDTRSALGAWLTSVCTLTGVRYALPVAESDAPCALVAYRGPGTGDTLGGAASESYTVVLLARKAGSTQADRADDIASMDRALAAALTGSGRVDDAWSHITGEWQEGGEAVSQWRIEVWPV